MDVLYGYVIVEKVNEGDTHQVFDKKPKQTNVVKCVEREGTDILANGCKEGKVHLSLDVK